MSLTIGIDAGGTDVAASGPVAAAAGTRAYLASPGVNRHGQVSQPGHPAPPVMTPTWPR